MPELKALAPKGHRRMSANPHANGGLLRKELKLPDFRDYAVRRAIARHDVAREHQAPRRVPARRDARTTRRSFRVFGPDETASNRLQAIYEASKKTWMADMLPEDADGGELARDGRVMEMLSEHTLLGWLEGYLLTGRHGFFHTYEAFAHVIDSMFNQHAKWLDISKNHVPWRAPVASENILLSSTVWRQDHNGFSHQDPGFIDLVTNKSPSVTRIYLPPDANTLLAVADQCLRSTDCINVIVADKQKHLQFTTIDEAIVHCAKGLGIWSEGEHRRRRGAGRRAGVLRRRGHAWRRWPRPPILRERLPDLKLRFVNVVDLFKLQPASEHPHGSTEREFDGLFTTDKPIIFNFHGYPWLIHKLAYRFKGPRQPARARLQGEGQHQHAARAGDAERDVPLPPGHRRDRSRAEAAHEGRAPEGGDEERDHRQPALRARARHGPAGDRQLDLALLTCRVRRAGECRTMARRAARAQRGLVEPEVLGLRR